MNETVNLIIESTRKGPVSQWVDRIGVIAEKIGMDTSYINWQGPPFIVAWSLYTEAERRETIPAIIEACKDFTNDQG